MDLGLKAVKLGCLGRCGIRMPADGAGAALGLRLGHESITSCVGRTHGASLRLALVACSDSAQSPSPVKRAKAKITRAGSTKNELKLLTDLQEFIASCNLPPNEVPTTVELARHGRQDLANRVKRKGYKQVAQLLEQVCIADTSGTSQSDGATLPSNGAVVSNDDVDLVLARTDDKVSNDGEEPSDVGCLTDAALQGFPISAGSASNQADRNGRSSVNEDIIRDASENQGQFVPGVGKGHGVLGKAVASTLNGDLFQSGNHETRGDSSSSTHPLGLRLDVTNEGRDDSVEEEIETEDMFDAEDDNDQYSEDDDDDEPRPVPVRADPKAQSPDIVYQKAALLKAKLLQYFDSRCEDLMEANSSPNANRMKQEAAAPQEWNEIKLGDIQSTVTQTVETPKELEQLEGLLHSREVELAEVSKQLEEARAMLSLARAKATAELVHVNQLAVEQDARLQAAEQALSQMKQVQLEWWGEAARVEVAGSFNGWHHYITLEPDFSSEIHKPNGGRGPMMWGTHLCLYTGIYEIKFIVDGNWQVDHRREVVTRHSNQNNILRVE